MDKKVSKLRFIGNPKWFYKNKRQHCRGEGGDIIACIFGVDGPVLPKDFGSMATKQNVGQYLEKQKSKLEQYLKSHTPQ